jgi:hypothetical protein
VSSGREAWKGESSGVLCGRFSNRTRDASPRQLPTDHDYAVSTANIRVINRRNSRLDRDLRCLPRRRKKKQKIVVDWSFHISTHLDDFGVYQELAEISVSL